MLILVLCVVALGQLVLGQNPQVTTSYGKLKGQVLKSRDGRDYFSFTKIPYAKPPIGKLRFMVPEKVENWTGILDATEPIPSCYQADQYKPGNPTFGQENCLYLNVFTPSLSGKYPVIFSIHGGGFNSGSAGIFGTAKYFMDEDVVFVAPNYRLGTFGFLSFEDDVVPGNMGLKDQALALEWVHNEISNFGGDPNMITVIGESAGGASSNIICAAPRTNALIKGCVSQSGVGWAPWAILRPREARHMTLNLAKSLGCSKNGLLECLQAKPMKLVGNISLMVDPMERVPSPSPVLESPNAPQPLLTSWPTAANHNYPWILGVCQDDGMLLTGAYEYSLENRMATEMFISGINNTIILQLGLVNKPKEFQKVRERFFTNITDPITGVRNFFTEYLFLNPALVALSKHPGPTYFYNFNYTGGPQMFSGLQKAKGVGHAAELPYFFEYQTDPSIWPKAEDVQLSKQLVKMWANFAKTQNPNIEGKTHWPQFQGNYVYNIQNSGISVENFTRYQEILGFWRSLTPNNTSRSTLTQSSSLFIIVLSVFAIFKSLIV